MTLLISKVLFLFTQVQHKYINLPVATETGDSSPPSRQGRSLCPDLHQYNAADCTAQPLHTEQLCGTTLSIQPSTVTGLCFTAQTTIS